MNTQYLYVLDFGDCTINCLYLHNGNNKPEDFKDTDKLLRYWGFNPNNCHYMFSDELLDINPIVLPLSEF